jgi:hypothetical protein
MALEVGRRARPPALNAIDAIAAANAHAARAILFSIARRSAPTPVAPLVTALAGMGLPAPR